MTKNVHQRLHAAMGDVDYVQKEKKSGMRYSIVSHDAVTALVRPVLHKHGIVYHIAKLRHGQDGNRTRAWVQMAFVNIDNPSDFITTESFGYGVDDSDKGPGKAISYAVKYALLKTLGLETGDDPDNTQDERANYRPTPGGISPGDFANRPGEPSARAGTPAWKILEDDLKKQSSPAMINDWWKENKKDAWKQMPNEFFWRFFSQMIERGIDLCHNKVALELFMSGHETALKALEKENYVHHGSLMEYMTTKVKHLGHTSVLEAG